MGEGVLRLSANPLRPCLHLAQLVAELIGWRLGGTELRSDVAQLGQCRRGVGRDLVVERAALVPQLIEAGQHALLDLLGRGRGHLHRANRRLDLAKVVKYLAQ